MSQQICSNIGQIFLYEWSCNYSLIYRDGSRLGLGKVPMYTLVSEGGFLGRYRSVWDMVVGYGRIGRDGVR